MTQPSTQKESWEELFDEEFFVENDEWLISDNGRVKYPNPIKIKKVISRLISCALRENNERLIQRLEKEKAAEEFKGMQGMFQSGRWDSLDKTIQIIREENV